MALSSLTYSTFLISSTREEPDHSLIHSWYYVQQIIKEYPNEINWSKFIKRLAGTKTQVLRLIEQIGLLTRNKTKYTLVHPKLDSKTLKRFINNPNYPFMNRYAKYQKHLDNETDFTVITNIIFSLIVFHKGYGIHKWEAKEMAYLYGFTISNLELSSENYEMMHHLLQYCPSLAARIPAVADIQKYVDLKGAHMKREIHYNEYIIKHLYANPCIDKDLFIEYIGSHVYNEFKHDNLLDKYIRNMFQFRIKKGLGIELHYPQQVKEDTKEWRIKLFELNIDLVHSGILAGHGNLIRAIPGRHNQYLLCQNIVYHPTLTIDNMDEHFKNTMRALEYLFM